MRAENCRGNGPALGAGPGKWGWVSRGRVLGLFVALLTLSGVATGAEAGAGPGAGGINPWAIQNENPNANVLAVSAAQSVQDAGNFNFITAHSIAYGCPVPPPTGGCPASRVPAMRSANPRLKIFLYMNATFAQSYQPPGGPGGFDPAWYAKDAHGSYVKNPTSGNYLMDPTSPGWIQHDADWCKSQLTGYDGCYLDALGLAPLQAGYLSAFPINPATKKPWTKPDWIRATASLAKQVRALVRPITVFGNGLTNGTFFFDPSQPTKQIVDGLDGGVAEGWLRLSTAPVGAYPPVATWKQNVDMIPVVEGEGKPLLVVTKLWSSATPAQQAAWLQYSLATFLLGTGGRSAFFFSGSAATSRTTPYTIYGTNVGTPTATYALSQGVYQRPFSNGLVIVNPGTSTVKVTLSRPYFTTSRQKVTSLVVAATSGVLLTIS
jgi:hypothetical protein